ncbi:hypothetical protein ABXS75_07210 [Roseburia hominis]
MVNNNRVLVIKLSPVRGLNSSMMRALAAVKGLVEKGFKVDLLTLQASASHVLSEKEYDFMDRVNVIYANPNRTYSSLVAYSNNSLKQKIVNFLRKLYHTFSVFDYSTSIAKKIKIDILPQREYEYVLAVSDPKTTHIAAQKLIKQGLKCNKLIEYWGDPLYGDITLKSIYPAFVYKNIEKRFLGIADKIVYTSPFTLREEQRLYPKLREKMIFTPTAYLEERILPARSGKYTVGYYGAYPSNIRNIVPLYDAGKNMKELIDLKIVGNSDLSLKNTNNIEVYPRGDISDFEDITDLFVCILNKNGTQIPGKLYHYAAYNRPILVIEDGDHTDEMHDFICSFNRYYTCKNNSEDIVTCIKQIMGSDEQWMPFTEMNSLHVISTILE